MQVGPGPDADPVLGTPTGNVDFYDGGTYLGTGGLDANGDAALPVSFLSGGDHPSVYAVYGGDGSFDASDTTAGPLDIQVQPEANAGTTTSLSVDTATSSFGQAISLTSLVAPAAGSDPSLGTPTGYVTFYDNGSYLGEAALDGNGGATLSVSSLGSGDHPDVTAMYGGDNSFTASDNTSGPLDEQVRQETNAPTTTSLSVDNNSSSYGDTIYLTAQVAPAAGTDPSLGADRERQLLRQRVVPGNGRLGWERFATLPVSSLAGGDHPDMTAVYGGDGSYASSDNTAGPLDEQVRQQTNAPTITTLSADTGSSSFGQAVNLTAVVVAAGSDPSLGTPTGCVAFYDNGSYLGEALLDGTGTATLPVSSLAGGDHPDLTAAYGGDGSYASGDNADGPLDEQVWSATTLSLWVDNGSPSYGQTVNLLAQVSPAAGPGPMPAAPTGWVSFFDGGARLGAGQLDGSGCATLAVSGLADGDHPAITAVYSGDGAYTGSDDTGSPLDVQMQPETDVPTTTALSADTAPILPGNAVNFTAVVAAVPGHDPALGAPTGNVDFYDGGTWLGSQGLDGNGIATLSVSSLPVGDHPGITAVYGGGGSFTGSDNTAGPLDEQVQEDTSSGPVASADTTTTLSADSTTLSPGQAVSLTAQVAAALGSDPSLGTPTGTVDFYDGGTWLGSQALDGNGTAVLAVPSLAGGDHADVYAVYNGDGRFNKSDNTNNPLDEQVQDDSGSGSGSDTADTTTTLTADNLYPSSGQSVTFTAQVTAAPGSDPSLGAPTGSINFYDNGVWLGSQTLDGNGVATLLVSSLSGGDHPNVTAVYGGDSHFVGSDNSGSPLDESVQDDTGSGSGNQGADSGGDSGSGDGSGDGFGSGSASGGASDSGDNAVSWSGDFATWSYE